MIPDLPIGTLVEVAGRPGTFEVVKVAGRYVGLISDSWRPKEGSSPVQFAVDREEVIRVVEFKQPGAEAGATPACGAEAVPW